MDPDSIVIFKIFNHILIFPYQSGGMVELGVPIPRFDPILTRPLKPQELFLVENHIKFLLKFSFKLN